MNPSTNTKKVTYCTEALSPLMEGPAHSEQHYIDLQDGGGGGNVEISSWLNFMKKKIKDEQQTNVKKKKTTTMMMKNSSSSSNAGKKKTKKKSGSNGGFDSRLLLGVLGCPLAPLSVSSHEPFPHLSIKNVSIEASSAQYIIYQYMAATGATRFQTSFHNSYISGKVRMATSETETASKKTARFSPKTTKKPLSSLSSSSLSSSSSSSSKRQTEHGRFVLWQMMMRMDHHHTHKWHIELALGGATIQAGSNGKIVWRYTPWLGAHAAKGPVRPLRRALQGLDPMMTASLFANAHCVGERRIGDEDCFVLKVAADQSTLSQRSDGPAEIIRHVLLGCFSHRTGFLVYLEDSHLTRIQATGSDVVYWETTIESSLKDYRSVDGVVLAHAGESLVTLYRFGDEAMSHSRTKMEETWSIEEVAFNVPGLSPEFFIPPSDIGSKDASHPVRKSAS